MKSAFKDHFCYFPWEVSDRLYCDYIGISLLQGKNIVRIEGKLGSEAFSFLAPLAEGQGAIVMVLCPSCVCPLICPSVRPSVRACILKLFLQKTSPQKLLTGFL